MQGDSRNPSRRHQAETMQCELNGVCAARTKNVFPCDVAIHIEGSYSQTFSSPLATT